MIISVTDKDIKLGGHGDPMNCPVSRAATRAVGARVCVFEGKLSWFDGTAAREVVEPWAVRKFVHRYDRAMSVQPFEFELLQ